MTPSLLQVLTAWSLDPVPLVDLGLVAGLYALGYWRLGRKAGGRARPPTWRAGAFAAGVAALAVAFFSPLDTFDGRSFAAHMLQHLLIGWIAPPLLWLGAPLAPMLWGLPPDARRRLGRWLGRRSLLRKLGVGLTTPYLSLSVFLVGVAAWHVPSLYDAAQGPTLVHDLEHLTFLVTGLLYWWPVVQPAPGRRRLEPMTGGILYLLALATEGGLIGGALTFSDRVIYPYYLQPAPFLGISPVADQHLAGIVMWLIGGLIDISALFILVGCFLAQEERQLAEHARV